MQQTLLPKRILTANGVENAEGLLRRKPMQIDLQESGLTVCKPGSFLILDFGKEMRGGVRILCHGSDGKPVRLRFGESVAECCAETDGTATNDHAMRDFSVTLPNWSDGTWGDTGFRFLRLDLAGECTLKSILCTNSILSRRSSYTYRGDRLLERIFAAAKRTVDLCAGSGYIWDGIKRDRLVWVGDLAPQVLAMTALYGRTPEVERSLDFAVAQAPLPMWMNNFPTYSMWWIIMLRDYWERTGADDFAEKHMEYLAGLVEQLAQGVNEAGEMDYPGYFLDWPRAGDMEEREGARAIDILAARAAIRLLEHFGRDASWARVLLARLLRRPIRPTCKVVAALKYLAVGTLSEEERTLLLSGGAAGLSTFMSYYVLTAVRAFDPALATEMLKEYYGGMLSLGATTFWEDFEPEQLTGTPIDCLPQPGKPDCHGSFGKFCYTGFRRSLCHGWSAGIIAFLKESGE